jgi:hypothetical protein
MQTIGQIIPLKTSMNKKTLHTFALVSLFCAAASFAQTGTPQTSVLAPSTPAQVSGPAPNSIVVPAHTVNEHASDNAKAVQAVLKSFDTKRDEIAAERKALLDKLHAATTDAERKTIIDQLRTEQKAQADERRALGKEIRDELKKVREARKAGGG